MNTSRSFDLSFRPHSYFWAADHNIRLSSDIKGARRKEAFERLSMSDDPPSTLDPLLTPVLDDEDRVAIGRIHPSFMGGEYLPDRRVKEVEIARIGIKSTTWDVTSVCARRGKNRICYRVVDEYGGDTLSGRAARTSIRHLTLKELVDFFLAAWELFEVLDCNFSDAGYPPDKVHGFVHDASSSFYPEFGPYVHALIDDWLTERGRS